VRGENGDVVGAVSVTALRAQASLEQLREILPDLPAITDMISKELGWTPAVRPAAGSRTDA
jgi:DNA-binding IclR family transcriptional regulator